MKNRNGGFNYCPDHPGELAAPDTGVCLSPVHEENKFDREKLKKILEKQPPTISENKDVDK